ncbi:MAG: alpha/beta hydrolase [Cellulophaga sp.]
MTITDLKTGENKVSYLSNGVKISALVYIPKDYKEDKKRPAIVITRPGSGVKEQTASIYAKKFCEQGFVTLAFDPKGFGESEGTSCWENPYSIIEDTKNAVSFICTLSQVATEKVFNIGICMGAGYAGFATALDSRIQGYAMITPDIGEYYDWREALGGAVNIRNNVLPIFSQARQNLFETGENTFFQMVPESEKDMKRPGVMDSQIQARAYYLNQESGGMVPNWKNTLNMSGIENLLGMTVFQVIDLLEGVPFFMATGTEAHGYKHAVRYYNEVNAPKDQLILDGVNHFDVYWKPEYVNPITEKIAAFFNITDV